MTPSSNDSNSNNTLLAVLLLTLVFLVKQSHTLFLVAPSTAPCIGRTRSSRSLPGGRGGGTIHNNHYPFSKTITKQTNKNDKHYSWSLHLSVSSSSSTASSPPPSSTSTSLSFTDILLDNVRRNDTSPITIDGYVISKRSLGKNLVFCDFQLQGSTNDSDSDDVVDDTDDDDNTTYDQDNLCQAMLRREYYQHPNDYEGHKRCLLKGTKLRVIGEASPTRNPGNAVLLIHSLELLTVPRQQQHIQILIRQVLEGRLSRSIVAKACHQPESMLIPPPTPQDDNNKEREVKQWLKQVSKDILMQLPEDKYFPKVADQVEFSKMGNFVRPPAPAEWQQLPQIIHTAKNNNNNNNSDDDDDNEDDLQVLSSIKQAALLQDEEVTIGENHKDVPSPKAAPASSPSDKEFIKNVSVQGWVQNRRRFDNNITVISLVDELAFVSSSSSSSSQNKDGNNSNSASQVDTERLVVILHPDLLEQQCAGLYSNVVAVETKVWVSGKLIVSAYNTQQQGNNDDDSNNNRQGRSRQPTILWVEQIRLVRSSSKSSTIRHLLDLLYDKQLELEEVADSLKLTYNDALKLQQSSDATDRQWKANELSIQLQQSKRNVVKPELLEIMKQYKPLSREYPVVETGISVSMNNKKKNVDTGGVVQAPVSPTIGMPGTKWQSKKRPQLEWMGQQILSVLQSHPDYGKRTLSILDIGGGKGSLANYLGKAMDDVEIHVVDICESAVKNGAKKAQRFNLPVQFQAADASSQTALEFCDNADVVVALHACGHLSDVALGHAVHRRAGFVIVPCCFNSNPHLTMPTSSSSHGSNDNDLGDHSSGPSVPEWLQVPPDDWSALKLLAEVQGDIALANEATAIICALRARATAKALGTGIDVKIRQFPLQYSTRNTVLVGTKQA